MQVISKNERNVLLLWVIFGAIVCGLVIFFNVKFDGASLFEKITHQVESKYSQVKDRDRYYTVITSVQDFYGYINDEDTNKVITVLDSKYKEKNSIDKNNVLDVLKIKNNSTVSSKNFMCQRKTGEGKYSYYVHLTEEDRLNGEYIRDVYYEVVLNHKTVRYTIQPISDKTFGGACNG